MEGQIEHTSVTLMSSDEIEFHVSLGAIKMSSVLSNALGDTDDAAENIIPVNEVHSSTLGLVVKYMEQYKDVSERHDDTTEPNLELIITEFDRELFNGDIYTILGVLNAANFLNVKSLKDVCGIIAAPIIELMPQKEIDLIFKADSAVDPDSKEAQDFRKKNAWLFETY